MSEPKIGLATALSGFGEAHTRAGAGELGEDPRDQARAPAADLFGLAVPETSAVTVPNRGGVGTRAGVPNKRTDSLKRYILSLGFKHPAVVLADIASADPKELRRKVPGLKAGEAMGLIKSAAEALMPYFEQKLPTAIELPPNDGRPVLIIGEMEARKHPASGEAMSLDDAIDELVGLEPLNEQDQALSEAENVRPEFSAPNDDS